MMNNERLKDDTQIHMFMDYHNKNKLKKLLNQNDDIRFYNANVYRQKKFKKSRRLILQSEEWDSRIRVS